jgi:hypothetical protein
MSVSTPQLSVVIMPGVKRQLLDDSGCSLVTILTAIPAAILARIDTYLVHEFGEHNVERKM